MRAFRDALPAGAGVFLWPARVLLTGLCALLLLGEPARAACTDLAAPGVDWRRCRLDGAALEGVDLTRARIPDASFQRAQLRGARLIGVDGRRARFISADLREAVLDRADLVSADFTNADLRGASLKQADLRRARLFGADLRGSDLTGANLEGADLLHAQLAGARWVDGTSICAPDSVGRCHPLPASGDAQPPPSPSTLVRE